MAVRRNIIWQLLKPLPEAKLRLWADKYEVDKYAKVHSTISDLYANVYLNIAELDGLTHLCECIDANPFLRRACRYKQPISISQLSRDNAETDIDFYIEAFNHLVERAKCLGIYKHAKKLKKFVVSTDGMFLELNQEVYTYAKQGYCPMAGGVRYGVKVHNSLNVGADDISPIAFRITTGDVHDTRMFEELEREVLKLLPREEVIFVNDLGYFSFNRFQRMCDEGKQFIVPLNPLVKGRKVEIRQRYHGTGLGDYVYRHHKMKCDLRLIVARVKKRKIRLLTNNWKLSPRRIVELYQCRWNSEVFHKEVKQYFHVKPVGQTWNALVIQIFSVFIAYLLILIFKHMHNPQVSILKVKRIVQEIGWLSMAEAFEDPPWKG